MSLSMTDILLWLYDEYASSSLQRRASSTKLTSLDAAEQRKLIDQLLTLRHPRRGPLPSPILESIECLLVSEQATDDHVSAEPFVDVASIPSYPVEGTSGTVYFFRGDLTRLTAKRLALVNPANTQMLGCFQPTHKCLDNVIHARAGPSVRAECAAAMYELGLDEVGTAQPMMTKAGVLRAGGIVHVAGPALDRGRGPTAEETKLLRETYLKSLDLVSQHIELDSIAFPCISTGIFAFPSAQAAVVALTAVTDWFHLHPSSPLHVVFVLWTTQDELDYSAASESIASLTLPSPLPVHRALRVPDKVKEWINGATGIIVHAGAGLSADAVNEKYGFGLDYTSTALFKMLYPGLLNSTRLKTLYHTIGYDWEDPLVQWGFILSHVDTVLNWGPTRTYQRLLSLAHSKKSYAVLTSNADNLFIQSGFSPDRVYPRQGTYTYFQCLQPCSPTSYFLSKPWSDRALPYLDKSNPRIPAELAETLIPKCPKCGGSVFLNVRGGDWFLETPQEKSAQSHDLQVEEMVMWAREVGGYVVVLELGCGFNTPSVVRFPSEQVVADHEDVVKLVRVNPQYPELHTDLSSEVAVGLRMGVNDFLDRLSL